MANHSMRNFYETIAKQEPQLLTKVDNPNFALHHISLPFRAVIVAPSGSGKTNMLLNLIELFSRGKGTFSTIHVITRCADEPIYQFLKTKSSSIVISEGLSTLPKLDPKVFDKTLNHLVVLDDLVLSKNLDSVAEHYCRCRKFGVSIIFISQSFYKIPKFCRSNCSLIICLKLSGQRDANLILSEFNLGVTKEKLLEIYEYCTREKFDAMIVDLETDKAHRFRRNFTDFVPV